jgi:hypothetical protein
MKSLVAAVSAIALLTAAGMLSAQARTTSPVTTMPPVDPNILQSSQLQTAAMPPWMQDDGSSSDYPVPMPSDRSGEALNTQYRDGITAIVPPGAAAPPGFAPAIR